MFFEDDFCQSWSCLSSKNLLWKHFAKIWFKFILQQLK